jgi:diguanylate cyclase (GGDEF)-like protein
MRKAATLGLVLFLVTYYALMLTNNQEISVLVSDIMSPIGILISISIMAYGVWNHPAGKQRVKWIFFITGSIFFLAGDIAWFYYEIILKQAPYPSIADIFYLIQAALFLIAMFMILPKFNLFRNSFDVIIAMTMCILVELKYILIPVISTIHADGYYDLISLLYPIFDIGLLYCTLVLFIYGDNDIRMFKNKLYILFGLISIFIDQTYCIESIYGVYNAGNLLDPLWAGSVWLLAIISLISAEFYMKSENRQFAVNKETYEKIRSSSFAIIYLCLVLFVIYVFSKYFIPDILSIGSGFLILLLIFRQVFSLKENEKLILVINKTNLQLQETNKMLNEEKQKLERLSTIDELTNIYNHRFIVGYLEEKIKTCRENKNELSIIFFDIDNFKIINDSYGHLFGDYVLKRICETITSNLMGTDFVGRYGGEEFLIVLPSKRVEVGYDIAERIRLMISSLEWENNAHVTISGGVAELDDERFNELLAKADKVMYEAKRLGKNRIERAMVCVT